MISPRRNRWIRIQGVALVMLVMSQVDRANIALGFPAMRAELGLSATAIGFATGVFFWGYLTLQIPLGRLASVWSAKRTLMILGIGWAVISATTALVHSETELVINRFLLGLSEGGTLPSFVVLMRAWFTRDERARANMVLMGTPLAIAVGNPLCGFAVGALGWHMMFVVTAIPALLWCLVWWWAIDDDPRQINWMPPAEKAALVAVLDAEAREDVASQHHWFRVIWNPVVLILSAYNLLGLTALWGLSYWLPTLLVEAGHTIGMSGLLSAIPYVASIGMALLLSYSSDRRRERKWHMLVPTFLAGVCMLLAASVGQDHLVALLLCLTLTVALWFGRITTYWILVADSVPKDAAGASMAIANGVGNFGGFLGPFVFGWLRTVTDSFDAAMVFGGIAFAIAAVIVMPMRFSATSRSQNAVPAFTPAVDLGNQ
jgi:MFS family permease